MAPHAKVGPDPALPALPLGLIVKVLGRLAGEEVTWPQKHPGNPLCVGPRPHSGA